VGMIGPFGCPEPSCSRRFSEQRALQRHLSIAHHHEIQARYSTGAVVSHE